MQKPRGENIDSNSPEKKTQKGKRTRNVSTSHAWIPMKSWLLSVCLKTKKCISTDRQPSKLVQDDIVFAFKHRRVSTTEHAVQTEKSDIVECDPEEVGFIVLYSDSNTAAITAV